MDMLTVVFTGLMVVENNQSIHFVKKEHHINVSVAVGTQQPKEYKARTGIEVKGLGADPVTKTMGVSLPTLSALLTTPASISVDPRKVTSIRLAGGNTEPMLDYVSCEAGGPRIAFWEGFSWRVDVPAGALLVLHGPGPDVTINLTNDMKVSIANDPVHPNDHSHVPMYKDVLLPAVTFKPISCDPFVIRRARPRERLEFMYHNPVTCPPFALQ